MTASRPTNTVVERRGVAVLVVPGDVLLQSLQHVRPAATIRSDTPVARPSDAALDAAADALNGTNRVTILAGAGCAGAHDEVVAIAAALHAPVVHALRGKEFVEYDNPYDIGMTGLLGFTSGLLLACHGQRHAHAHEWTVFEDVDLPDGKILVPGVLDSTTNYIEHPELVAQRIVRYARLVGRENVIAGTDCGFASFAASNVDRAIVWAQLAAMAEGARRASAQLW